MCRVAAHARGHTFVTELLQSPPVDRCSILDHLVHPKAGIVPSHEPSVRMAAPTELRDVAARRLGEKSQGRVHPRKPRGRLVTAVTCHAAKPPDGVYVLGERLRWSGKPFVIHEPVAGDTIASGRFLSLRHRWQRCGQLRRQDQGKK